MLNCCAKPATLLRPRSEEHVDLLFKSQWEPKAQAELVGLRHTMQLDLGGCGTQFAD